MAVAASGYRHHRHRMSCFCVCAVQLGILLPIVATALYAFLTIRFEDTSILDFIKYACAFFITKQQLYEWKLQPAVHSEPDRKQVDK